MSDDLSMLFERLRTALIGDRGEPIQSLRGSAEARDICRLLEARFGKLEGEAQLLRTAVSNFAKRLAKLEEE